MSPGSTSAPAGPDASWRRGYCDPPVGAVITAEQGLGLRIGPHSGVHRRVGARRKNRMGAAGCSRRRGRARTITIAVGSAAIGSPAPCPEPMRRARSGRRRPVDRQRRGSGRWHRPWSGGSEWIRAKDPGLLAVKRSVRAAVRDAPDLRPGPCCSSPMPRSACSPPSARSPCCFWSTSPVDPVPGSSPTWSSFWSAAASWPSGPWSRPTSRPRWRRWPRWGLPCSSPASSPPGGHRVNGNPVGLRASGRRRPTGVVGGPPPGGLGAGRGHLHPGVHGDLAHAVARRSAPPPGRYRRPR